MKRVPVPFRVQMVPGEFGERVLDAAMGARVDAEFVVTAADVLHERVTTNDHPGSVIAFESTHRTEPRLSRP